LKHIDVLIDLFARHNRLHNLCVSAFDARHFTIVKWINVLCSQKWWFEFVCSVSFINGIFS